MRALCVTPDRTLALRDVPTPREPPADHLVVRMEASAINAGDVTFLRRAPPMGIALSQHDVWGVSGAGTVIAVGGGVPASLGGKRVAVYRSLVSSAHTIGCWSEYAQLHVRSCCVLPDDADPRAYSGSLVNIITPYAFWQQARSEGHHGVLVTAGTSATGVAMLGLAQASAIPVVSIVRTEAGKRALVALGARDVVVTESPGFEAELRDRAERLRATALFDGVGGELLTRIAPELPRRSTVYAYGMIAGPSPFAISNGLLMAKSLTLQSFSNFGSPTVQDPRALESALHELAQVIGRPHFQTQIGRAFAFEEIDAAIAYGTREGGKALLVPS